MTKQEVLRSLARWASEFGLPARRVIAIAQVESQLDAWAYRYEPRFAAWLKARLGSVHEATEVCGRSTSWGPMQVMGQVAREEGFTGRYLTELCGEEGIRYGCKHLARLLNRHHDLDLATEAYNAGKPGTRVGQAYLERVKDAERVWSTGARTAYDSQLA